VAAPEQVAARFPLVIGYGNELRGDDGVGREVAERLESEPRLSGVRVVSVRQLTPELALDVSDATVVVFVDGRADRQAGVTSVDAVPPTAADTPLSHHVRPGALVALAASLYGFAPPAWTVGIGVGSLELGDGLSVEVAAAIPDAIDAVVRLVTAADPAQPAPSA
jgi:hydrogenase maturation protease